MIKATTGILLAGGLSSRMKTEKGLLKHQGKALIEYALEALQTVCTEVVLSSNTDSFDYLGLSKYKDFSENIGPMGGIYSCMKSSTQEHHLVLACDMPVVDAGLLRLIASMAEGYEMVVPTVDGNAVPVCGYYHRSILPLLEREIADGNYSLYRLLGKCRSLTIETTAAQAHQLMNVNTPEEFSDLINNKQ